MKLHSLIKTTATRQKRLGQGYGSGKGGHTSSRGQKGQKARGKMPLTFIGSSWVWFKRLPFMRGKDRFKSLTLTQTILLSDLNRFAKGAVVDSSSLREAGFGQKSNSDIVYKIVNSGKLEKSLTVKVKATKSAVEAIIKAGGDYQGETA